MIIDRRKKTLTNRARRFVNSYWLVPVFILYLEFFAIILPPTDSPVKNLKDRNLHLISGPVVLFNLVTSDFPYTLLGHFKEIAIVKKYTFNIGQVHSEDIHRALEDKDSIREIYRRLIESRNYNNTEIGGITTLVYGPEGPRLHLYEITSMNKAYSDKFHALSDSSTGEFLSLIQKNESRELLTKVEMDDYITSNLVRVLSSDNIEENLKIQLIRDFIRTYDVHSESKYILSPYDFKSFLGSIDINGEYIGIFHFHNNYMEPPSEIDISNSHIDRQIVLTPSYRGIILYDIMKGKQYIHRSDLTS